jgi:hypothetical protein
MRAEGSSTEGRKEGRKKARMLKISKRQLTVIDRSVEEAYAREMARYLRREHAEVVARLTDEELLRRVSVAIDRAVGYGLTFDESITAFVAIMFEVSPTFDEQPAIRAVLRDESIAPNLRIDALWPRTTDEDWDEAERLAEHAETLWRALESAHSSG